MLDGEKNQPLVEGIRNDIAEMDRLISQALLLARGVRDEEPELIDVGEQGGDRHGIQFGQGAEQAGIVVEALYLVF